MKFCRSNHTSRGYDDVDFGSEDTYLTENWKSRIYPFSFECIHFFTMTAIQRGSQFADAAAIFRRKESQVLKMYGSARKISPELFLGSSLNTFLASPNQSRAKYSSLTAPSFVSPTLTNVEKLYHLGKGLNLGDSGIRLSFSASPTSSKEPKTNSKSWKGKISFQATPLQQKKKSPVSSFSNSFYVGSYLSKSPAKPPPRNLETFAPLPETPDIKIEVKISNIEEKIRARKERMLKSKERKVPEAVLKYREREANRKKAEQQKRNVAATKLQACVMGWRARSAYPRLLLENQDRLEKIRQREAEKAMIKHSAIRIQKTFRGFVKRKKFLPVLARYREIKRIEEIIQNMPEKTKAEIEELKEEYAQRREDFKWKIRQQVRKEEEELMRMKRSGADRVKYLREEGKKLRASTQRLGSMAVVLENQNELLLQENEEITANFHSLQSYVQRRSKQIQKHQISSQKCRHRYLPKYRAEVANRKRRCIAEYRVKLLYEERLQRIVKEIEKRSRDPQLVEMAREAFRSCEVEVNALPERPIPEDFFAS